MILLSRRKKIMNLSELRIHLVAPASGLAPERMQALRDYVATWNITIPEPLLTKDNYFHAGSDTQRFEQLRTAIEDESAQIIWALRGGYGCARLLERLQQLPKPKHKKIFIGFSDNTALHLFFSQHWQWRCIHGAGLAQLVDLKPYDPANFNRIAELFNPAITQQMWTALTPLNQAARHASSITGHLQGGNLTLVENSLGTFWQANTAGSILLLEEVGEKGYRIDRSLLHLTQAGLFKAVNAVVFGECSGADTHAIAYALQRFADENPFPVYQTKLFGHEASNYPFIYGANATLALEKTGLASLVMDV
jgi:muramoyltetrapeptide carboxypeptidase